MEEILKRVLFLAFENEVNIMTCSPERLAVNNL